MSSSGNRVAGNTIAGNQGAIAIFGGAQNTITGNQIFSNVQIGIDLGADLVTPNDPGDGDAGANGLQNFPVLTSAFVVDPTHALLIGSLNSAPNQTYSGRNVRQLELPRDRAR